MTPRFPFTRLLAGSLMLLAATRAPAEIATAPVPRTGQSISHYPGDDGTLTTGIIWPIPRFTDHNNDTVTDTLTGLMWTRNANPIANAGQWTTALNFCSNLVTASYDDWRMPNLREMLSLVNYGRSAPPLPDGHPFTNVPAFNYWTSTTSRDDALRGWMISGGTAAIAFKDGGFHHYVWPVRGTTTRDMPAPVPVTGQTIAVSPQDDGDLRRGIPQPGYRFVNVGDGTIIDRSTGLMWTQNVNPFAGGVAWITALESCAAYAFAEHTDWRLPTVRELHSLVDYATTSRLPDGHPFVNYSTDRHFWSSTTSPGNTTRAYTLAIAASGAIREELKSSATPTGGGALWAWPVRGPVEIPPAPLDSGLLLLGR